MEAVFVVDEIASAEEEKNSDVADAGTTKDSENDEEHRDFTEANVVE